LVLGAQPGTVLGVTPRSAEVRQLMQRGLDFLATADDARLGAYAQTLGCRCLVAMALTVNGYPVDHPMVVRAVEACRVATAQGPDQVPVGPKMYDLAIAAIFLCELEPGLGKHDQQIRVLMEALRRRQKRHGGWGYEQEQRGDTSMTQYGVLSAWVANRAGFGMPVDSIVRVCNWLLRTQDPSGGWGYKGYDPGDFRLVEQTEVRQSVSAAGLGSLFICADLLGIGDLMPRASDPDLPAALKEVEESQDGADRPLTSKVDRSRLRTAILRGNRWFQANYRIDPPKWTHYYLYALERYMSFRELAEGRLASESKWYDEGFRFLSTIQAGNGSWPGECGAGPDTAFAVLFLSRATRSSIGRAYGEGTLTGGRGLPRDLINARLERGSVLDDGLAAPAMDLIRILSDPDHPDHGYLIHHGDKLVNEANRAVLAEHADRLQILVRRGTPEARRIAIRALSQTRDLDRVPLLIFALTDPDWRVVKEASDGLRLMSRRFEGFALPPLRDEAARRQVLQEAQGWYRSIRPNADFDE
ncbi:MAG: hypothetical protein A2W31_04470, partial [Planctomycetes bacterium RBG_16_64_10]